MNSTLVDIQARLLEGETLSRSEHRRLKRALEDEPELSRRLIDDEQIDVMLRTLGRFEDAGDSFVDNVMAAVSGRPRFPELAETHDSATMRTLLAGRRSSRRLVLTASILTAVLLGSALLIAFVQNPDEDAPDNHRRQGPPPGGIAEKSRDGGPPIQNIRALQPKGMPPRQGDDQSVDSTTLARILVSKNCRWKGGRPPGPSLSAGSLHLLAGRTKIAFDTGTIVELTGPAVFSINSPSETVLQSGHLSATVPRRAVGFTVETPVSRIVDLGTRFEIAVALDTTVNLKVHEGVVEYRALAPAGDAGERWKLTAGASHREQRLPNSKTWQVFQGVIVDQGIRYRYATRQQFETLRAAISARRDAKP